MCLWLHLDCTWIFKHMYKQIVTYIHQIYSNKLLKLKNMDWFSICALYGCIFSYGFYLNFLKTQYTIHYKNRNICKKKMLK
jgi:hypothetical protein